MGKLLSKSKHKTDRYSNSTANQCDNLPPEVSNVRRQYSPVHTDAVASVAAVSPGLILSGGKDNLVALFDYQHGNIVQKWTGHQKDVTKVAYASSLDAFFSSSRDQSVQMWHRGEPTPKVMYQGHTLVVTALSLNTDNTQLCSGSRDNCVQIWDVQTGESLSTRKISRNLVTDVKWAQNSDTIIQTSEDKLVRVWDARCEDVVHEFPRKQHIQTSCDISTDGHYCVTASNGFSGNGCEATLWDMRQINAVHEFKGHTQTTGACMFLSSPGGLRNLVATCSNDQAVRIWDRDSAECISSTVVSGSGPLTSLASPETDKLCVGSFHTGIHVFKLLDNAGQMHLSPFIQF